MKTQILAAALCLAIPVSVAGCSSSWWQDFKNNPVQQVQSFEATTQVVLNDAAVAWSFVQALLPKDKAPQIAQQYQKLLAATNHALAALNDAVTAAVDAKVSNPDFTQVMSDVSSALGQVLAMIDVYETSPPAPGPDAGLTALASASAARIPGLDDAHAQLAQLKSHYSHL